MKYWFLKIEIKSGEYTHYDLSVHTGAKFDAADYVADYYADAQQEDNGWYSTDCMNIIWRVADVQPVTKQQYTVLKQFI